MTRRLTMVAGLCVCALFPALAAPQAVNMPAAAIPPADYQPITGHQRLLWIIDGEVGPRSLFVGAMTSGGRTYINSPEEWERTWHGFGVRFLNREIDVGLSNSLEAGLGSIWGEDPRYLRSNRHGAWPRISYALKTVFVAPRRDGRLAPVWGRLAGNVFNNLIENTWLPPSMTTPGQTTVRSASGFASRSAGNLWDEFEPDLFDLFRR